MPPSPSLVRTAKNLDAPTTSYPFKQQQAQLPPLFDIVDIRTSKEARSIDLDEIILESLDKGEGEKSIPTLVLYDSRGLQLFDQITYLEEYYLTNAEIDILQNKINEIVSYIKDGSAVIELGAGYVDFCLLGECGRSTEAILF